MYIYCKPATADIRVLEVYTQRLRPSQALETDKAWIPAFAGMTGNL